jgi:hypothetical protein
LRWNLAFIACTVLLLLLKHGSWEPATPTQSTKSFKK